MALELGFPVLPFFTGGGFFGSVKFPPGFGEGIEPIRPRREPLGQVEVQALLSALQFLPETQRSAETARLIREFPQFFPASAPAPAPSPQPTQPPSSGSTLRTVSSGGRPPVLTFLPPVVLPEVARRVTLIVLRKVAPELLRRAIEAFFPDKDPETQTEEEELTEIDIEALPELLPGTTQPVPKREKISRPRPPNFPDLPTRPQEIVLPPRRQVEDLPAEIPTQPQTAPETPVRPAPAPTTTPTSIPAPTVPTAPSRVSTGLGVGLITGAGLFTALAPSRLRPGQRARARTRTRTRPRAPEQPVVPSIPTAPTLVPAQQLTQQAQRLRERQRQCKEVKRRRRRKGKCMEGFYEEWPGKTIFQEWREVDCITRKTVRDFKEKPESTAERIVGQIIERAGPRAPSIPAIGI